MKKILALVVIAAALASSTAAFADWEGTHWGDSAERVIAAVGKSAKNDKGGRDDRVSGQDRLASSKGEFRGMAARSEYFFDQKGGLSVVQISPRNAGDCVRFVNSFINTMGKPVSDEVKPIGPMVLRVWHWVDAANNLDTQVVLIVGAKVNFAPCHVTYSPAAPNAAPISN